MKSLTEAEQELLDIKPRFLNEGQKKERLRECITTTKLEEKKEVWRRIMRTSHGELKKTLRCGISVF